RRGGRAHDRGPHDDRGRVAQGRPHRRDRGTRPGSAPLVLPADAAARATAHLVGTDGESADGRQSPAGVGRGSSAARRDADPGAAVTPVELFLAPFADYDFRRRAPVACLALSLGCGPVGVLLVLRRMSLMGDALSHAVLPGAAAGFLLAGLSLTAMT